MIEQKTLVGTKLKMVVNFCYPTDPAITLDTINFYVEFFCSLNKKLVLQKDDLIRHEETVGEITTVTWYAMVDTTVVGSGRLKMRLMAYIPDDDSSEGVRKEYAEVETGVIIDMT